ncbi:neural cell adhesion molecule 1-like [Polyodon spathula]|uniref:neural cell adhesion molecule 1-like n=1 Tax=Polyodon spathula TaxID=7913 RepID=UPI001B7EBBEF|nr:neural cell adhesion molecule 1-like [Polyodon spathula]
MKWFSPEGTEIENEGDERFQVETIDETTKKLMINNAETSDNGVYKCVATFEDWTEKSATVTVNVLPPPIAWISEDSVNVTAGSASRISITCVVEGHPRPHVNWTRNGRPINAKPGRLGFNSDQSVLTIYAVEKADEGQYTCIATNKINSSSDNVTLHVSVKPEVQLERSTEARPLAGVSITCNATGDPVPTIHWVRKGNKLVSDSRTQISQKPDSNSSLSSTLTLQKVEPSDWGTYTCVATSPAGEDRRNVLVQTDPPPFTPDNVRANPGVSSLDITLKSPELIEGAEILRYKLQWRQEGANQWSTKTVEANNALRITDLLPNTPYEVRVAAINKIGEGGFSAQHKIHTLASMAQSVSPKPVVGTGGIVGIVMVIFLVLLVAVDTACYFTNHCGLMMCIAVNLLGKRPPGAKGQDEERNVSTVDVGLKGLSAQRGGGPNQPNEVLSDVTCDQAPLTRFEKMSAKDQVLVACSKA